MLSALVFLMTTVQVPAKLPDDFARSAFKVLKGVESEAGEYTLDAGRLLEPKASSAGINDLDADATTQDERQVVSTLKSFLDSRLTHNTELHVLSARARNLLLSRNLPHSPADVSELLRTSPTVSAIQVREDQCSLPFEAALRSRSWTQIAACGADHQAVALPEHLDFVMKQ